MSTPPPILHAAATATEATLLIDGKTYPACGVYPSIPVIKYDSYRASDFVHGEISVPNPFTPPPGWGFSPSVVEALGFYVVFRAGGTDAETRVRIVQFHSDNYRSLHRLGWQLVRI